jgi:hypothetical protein
MKDKRSTSGACLCNRSTDVENLNMAVNQKSGNLTKQENHEKQGFQIQQPLSNFSNFNAYNIHFFQLSPYINYCQL